jgi:hypothetical protein
MRLAQIPAASYTARAAVIVTINQQNFSFASSEHFEKVVFVFSLVHREPHAMHHVQRKRPGTRSSEIISG